MQRTCKKKYSLFHFYKKNVFILDKLLFYDLFYLRIISMDALNYNLSNRSFRNNKFNFEMYLMSYALIRKINNISN